jgi:hypothetical protein
MEWWSGDGGGEEFRLKRQEVQELSTKNFENSVQRANDCEQTADKTCVLAFERTLVNKVTRHHLLSGLGPKNTDMNLPD